MKSKRLLLFILTLVSLGGVAVYADCTNNTPADGEVVTCTPNDDDPGDPSDAVETDSVGTGFEDNVTVNNSGSIQTGWTGIELDENATINNTGDINQNSFSGVAVFSGTVNNSGNINQNGDIGVEIIDVGTVNNSGNINENDYGGVSVGDGTVNNTGNINQNDSFGVAVFEGTVNNSGNINQNTDVGVTVFDGTVNNTGNINDNGIGGVVIFQGTVNNFGNINQNTDVGVISFLGNINNSGNINQNIGDGALIFDGSINNSGQILNNDGFGVSVASGGTVTNSGLIAGNDALGTNTQVYFDDCGCGGANVFIQTQSGRVIGVAGDVAIQMGDDDDTVFIDIRSEVVGIIDGGNEYDRLIFTISSTDPAEVAAFSQFMSGVSILDNTLTYQGRTFFWENFEELATLIQTLAEEAANPNPQGGDAEGFCANLAVAAFRLPNRDLQVFSGFDLMPPNGFEVGVISMDALQRGERRFASPNPANWFVEVSPTADKGRWRATVFDANRNAIGGCDFLFTLRD